jgi:N-methylhydantoinase B/oxoprolinase/acetone carboxylase alpha subunit
MSILSERRTLRPYGMAGGEDDGKCGRNLLVRENGIIGNMGGRCSGTMDVGERLRIETLGGGGCGPPPPKEQQEVQLLKEFVDLFLTSFWSVRIRTTTKNTGSMRMSQR